MTLVIPKLFRRKMMKRIGKYNMKIDLIINIFLLGKKMMEYD